MKEIEKNNNFETSEEYKKWYEKYSTEELVDLKQYFNEEDFEILKKLGISVKNKVYTEREFEELDGDYILYYYEDGMEEGMSEEEKASIKSLENTGVSREEYNRLLDKFHNYTSSLTGIFFCLNLSKSVVKKRKI